MFYSDVIDAELHRKYYRQTTYGLIHTTGCRFLQNIFCNHYCRIGSEIMFLRHFHEMARPVARMFSHDDRLQAESAVSIYGPQQTRVPLAD